MFLHKHKVKLPQVETKITFTNDVYMLLAKEYHYTPEQINNFTLDLTFTFYYNIIAKQYKEFLSTIYNEPN